MAALALKHRQNKVQNQRIIAFVGSPIRESDKELEKLAKKMKKNNVAVDIVNFGEENVNTAKLEKFHTAVNNHDNSHLVTVPPGPRLLYEVIATSSILAEEGFEMADSNDFFGGVDANMDPDLALALRLSLEEEKQRQEREAKESKETKDDLTKIEEEDEERKEK